jgi:hypothetical protein
MLGSFKEKIDKRLLQTKKQFRNQKSSSKLISICLVISLLIGTSPVFIAALATELNSLPGKAAPGEQAPVVSISPEDVPASAPGEEPECTCCYYDDEIEAHEHMEYCSL